MTRDIPAPPTTVFDHMSRLAREQGAINLGQGFPDMPDPPELLEAARRALVERSNQYPPMRGLTELRTAIARYYGQEQGLDIAQEEVIVTSGATEALAAAILTLVRPGDEVILVQPFYDAYLPLVKRAGGTARFIDLSPPDWSFPLDALEAAMNSRTRLLILNTPNNPTGTMLDAATLSAIGDLCARHDVLLLSDEVWEAMLVDGTRHMSTLAIPSLRERTIKVGSAGKIFSLTGWKVGWAVAAPPLAEALAGQHQFLTFTTPPSLQWAVASGLDLAPEWHEAHRARYRHARARLVAGLESGGYAVLPNVASWFVSIDLAKSGLPMTDREFCERIIPKAGVAAIPISAFYAERPQTGYARLCFAKGDDVLDKAAERLSVFRRSAAV